MRRTLLLIGFSLTTFLGTGGQTAWAEVTEVELLIDGLSCPFCVFNIEKPLKRVTALESFETNYKEGLVRGRIKPDQPIDLGQLKAAVSETGFTLRAIRLSVIGTIGVWEGHPALETRGTRQQLLLYQEEKPAAWPSTGTLVKVSGTVHEHKGLPPGLRVEDLQEIKP